MKMHQTLSRILSSRWFRISVVCLFVLQALWFVFSAVYPMAFDEDFHLGLIKIYAQHGLPFLKEQPAGADVYGAVARDPSYLYHYLMSFPYRLAAHATANQTAQIIMLRLINVALFTSGLLLFYKLMLKTLRSPALSNVALAIFTLIPIVPQLAAHINYDTLLLPLVAWVGLLVYELIEQLQAGVIKLKTLLLLLSVCLLASLVKYAFLPIMVAVGLFVPAYAFIRLRRQPLKNVWRNAQKGLTAPVAVGLVLMAVVSSALFVQRYGINVVKYHTPIAECDQVLDYDHCSAYGPWIRNYTYAEAKPTVNPNPLRYLLTWEQGLRFRLFFAINGPTHEYANYPPLPLPYNAALVLGIAGLIALLFCWRVLSREPFMVFAFLASSFYLAALFIEDYSQYLETGQPVAINGRYLLPILFLCAILIGRAFQQLSSKSALWIKPVAASVLLLCFLQGGGVMTFILRSEPSWDWQNNTVIRVNNTARKILSPVIWEGSKYY